MTIRRQWHYLFSVSLGWKPVQRRKKHIWRQMIKKVMGSEKKTTWIGILWIMDQQLNAWNCFKGEKTVLLFWLLGPLSHFFTLSPFFIPFFKHPRHVRISEWFFAFIKNRLHFLASKSHILKLMVWKILSSG